MLALASFLSIFIFSAQSQEGSGVDGEPVSENQFLSWTN